MFTILAVCLFIVLVAIATGMGLLSVRVGRTMLMVAGLVSLSFIN